MNLKKKLLSLTEIDWSAKYTSKASHPIEPVYPNLHHVTVHVFVLVELPEYVLVLMSPALMWESTFQVFEQYTVGMLAFQEIFPPAFQLTPIKMKFKWSNRETQGYKICSLNSQNL